MHQQLRKQTREINDLNSLDSTLRVIFASFSPPHAISNFSGKDLRNMIFWRIKLYKKKKDTILSMKYMVWTMFNESTIYWQNINHSPNTKILNPSVQQIRSGPQVQCMRVFTCPSSPKTLASVITISLTTKYAKFHRSRVHYTCAKWTAPYS